MKLLCKKVISLLMAGGMLLSGIPVFSLSALAESDAETETEEIHIWDGSIDMSWFDEEETELHISTPEQFAGFLKNCSAKSSQSIISNKTYIIDNDLYMNDISNVDQWDGVNIKPVNQMLVSTLVILDSCTVLGNGHSIIGLYISGSSQYEASLFGEVRNSTIDDLHIKACFYTSEKSISFNFYRLNRYNAETREGECVKTGGSIAADLTNSNLKNCSISGIYKRFFPAQTLEHHLLVGPNGREDRTGDHYTYYCGVYGGLVGNCSNSIIDKCNSAIKMEIDTKKLTEKEYTQNSGHGEHDYNIREKHSLYAGFGGICGNAKQSKIINSTFSGSLQCGCPFKGYKQSSGTVTTGIGGICGVDLNSVFRNNKCSGSIRLNDSTNGSIKQTGKTFPSGGICGYAGASDIQSCCNYGTISASSDSGGIVGSATLYNSVYPKIAYCYNCGDALAGIGYSLEATVSNTFSVGMCKYGIAAFKSDNVTWSNAYYLNSGQTTNMEYGIAKSEANMKKEEFVQTLGNPFIYVEGEYPKLAFELEQDISAAKLNKKSILLTEYNGVAVIKVFTTYPYSIEWISSDPSVVEVDGNDEGCELTALKNGTAIVYAICGDSSVSCPVTVNFNYFLHETELTMEEESEHLLQVFSSATDTEIDSSKIPTEWKSSDEAIASVDSTGIVTAKSVGNAIITAECAGMTLECSVEVYEKEPVVIVTDDKKTKLSETEFSLSEGETKQLTVENYNDAVTWVSKDSKIATVNENGTVQGVAEGETTILAMLENGTFLKATVTVTKSEKIFGDLNGDGQLTISDAILLARIVAEDSTVKTTEAMVAAADLDGDGYIGASDTTILLKTLAGIK